MDKPVHGRAVRTAGACAAGRSLVTRRAVAGRVLRCVRWTSVRGSCQRPVARVWAWADVQSAALSACHPGPSIRNCGVWIRQTDFN